MKKILYLFGSNYIIILFILSLAYIISMPSKLYCFQFESYFPCSLQEIIHRYRYIKDSQWDYTVTNKDKSTSTYMTYSIPKYRITGKFLGYFKPIDPDKKMAITLSLRSKGVEEKLISSFNNEVAIESNFLKYWFPIQDILIPQMKSETKKDQIINLYTVFIGKIVSQNNTDWILIVNEFQE